MSALWDTSTVTVQSAFIKPCLSNVHQIYLSIYIFVGIDVCVYVYMFVNIWCMCICAAQTSKVHHKFSPLGWVLDQSSVFAQVDAFIQRCKDLIEVGCITYKSSGSLLDYTARDVTHCC